jgi:hypothetical protein
MDSSSKFVASTVLVSCMLAVAGCDQPSTVIESIDDSVDLRKKAGNGVEINHASLNGFTLNGFTLNGFTLNGFTLNGFTLNGFTLNGVALEGSEFSAETNEEGPVSGTGLIGAQLTLTQASPFKIFVLTMEDIYPVSTPGGDVLAYDISVHDVFAQVTESLCSLNDEPVPMIPLNNHWDAVTGDRIDATPGAVTFACHGGALAKCVEWGYLPWATRDDVSLAEHHQACTRMVRADYCGDGTPHTFNGTPIDIFDGLNPQIQESATLSLTNWGIEAEWGPEGVVCVGAQLRGHMFQNFTAPDCFEGIDDIPTCGDLDSERGGHVANRYCDAWNTDPEACDEENP